MSLGTSPIPNPPAGPHDQSTRDGSSPAQTTSQRMKIIDASVRWTPTPTFGPSEARVRLWVPPSDAQTRDAKSVDGLRHRFGDRLHFDADPNRSHLWAGGRMSERTNLRQL